MFIPRLLDMMNRMIEIIDYFCLTHIRGVFVVKNREILESSHLPLAT